MKKIVLLLVSIFLFGIFSVYSQEMNPKEQTGYAVGVMLVEKIKESGMDIDFGAIRELFGGGFIESLKAGFRDGLVGDIKFSQEELMVSLAPLLEKIAAMQNQGKEDENAEETQNVFHYASRIAQYYCSISYYYLFIKEYAQSEQAARKALEIDSEYILSKTNLAHALLFQNRFAEAEAIYKELSQTIYQNDETYNQVLLKDLKELEDAGVIPEERKGDVEKIRAMLGR